MINPTTFLYAHRHMFQTIVLSVALVVALFGFIISVRDFVNAAKEQRGKDTE